MDQLKSNKEPRPFTASLRPLRLEDWQLLQMWRNNPDLRDPAMGYPFPITEQMEKAWIERCSKSPHENKVVFGVEEIKEKRLVGVAHLSHLEWIHGTCQAGMFIGDTEHRRGFGGSGLYQLCDYAFTVLNFRKIVSYVAAFNSASSAMAEKIGFKREGLLRDQVYLRGSFHDVHVISLFRSDLTRS